MFYQIATDGTQRQVDLSNLYAGPTATTCWVIAGGPSLNELPVEKIASSPVPKFAMNLAGHGSIRPNFWTSYDPTTRFQRSVYLDASIMKFVHRGRAMDLVPETSFKVCEAPATLFLERSRSPGFVDFLQDSDGITDWQDSLIQAIDIAYQLGFRELLLAGTDMFIAPSLALQQRGDEVGVTYKSRELLRDYIKRLADAGLSRSEIESLATGPQYHFAEQKDFGAAINTDFHYFRVAQYLRLARKSLALRGLKLTSVTPHSRLNDYFDYEPIADTLQRIEQQIGNPATEQTQGLYSQQQDRKPKHLGPMRDFKPHFWPEKANPVAREKQAVDKKHNIKDNRQRPNTPLPEVEVDINEVG